MLAVSKIYLKSIPQTHKNSLTTSGDDTKVQNRKINILGFKFKTNNAYKLFMSIGVCSAYFQGAFAKVQNPSSDGCLKDHILQLQPNNLKEARLIFPHLLDYFKYNEGNEACINKGRVYHNEHHVVKYKFEPLGQNPIPEGGQIYRNEDKVPKVYEKKSKTPKKDSL